MRTACLRLSRACLPVTVGGELMVNLAPADRATTLLPPVMLELAMCLLVRCGEAKHNAGQASRLFVTALLKVSETLLRMHALVRVPAWR
eukprot:12444868-Alexandrium_andersonii.AAC.1